VEKIYYISTFYDDSYVDILDPKTIKYKDEVYCTYCFEAVSERLHRPLDWEAI
jgi:hypothetical protein